MALLRGPCRAGSGWGEETAPGRHEGPGQRTGKVKGSGAATQAGRPTRAAAALERAPGRWLPGAHAADRDVGDEVILAVHRGARHAAQQHELADVGERVVDRALEQARDL